MPAPGHGVIVGTAPPGGLDGGEIGRTGESVLHQHLELLQTGAEAILEDRIDPAFRSFLQRRDMVDVLQRPYQRLLADDMPPGGEHLLDHRPMGVRRGAEVDDVDAVKRQERIEGAQPVRDRILFAVGLEPLGIEIADRLDLIEIGQRGIGLEMIAPDPEADDGDAEAAHASGSRRTALASAVSASSIAR